jgi:hypothetical protein
MSGQDFDRLDALFGPQIAQTVPVRKNFPQFDPHK